MVRGTRALFPHGLLHGRRTHEAGHSSGLMKKHSRQGKARAKHAPPALFDDGTVFHGGIASNVDIGGAAGELKADEA